MLRDAMMYTGMDLIRTAAVRRDEKRLHTEAMEELSTSFDDEVKPMVVEIEGTQHRLTGTADAQYEEWKELLLELYSAETGFVPEIDVYTEALPEPPPEVADDVGGEAELPVDAEGQELEVYTIEPDDLEMEEESATEATEAEANVAPETIAGAS